MSAQPQQRGGRGPDRAIDRRGREGAEPAIRVLIVEDHTLFAEAISPLLEGLDMEVVGVAGNGEEALHLIRRERPDLVLLDLGLPDVDGIALGRTILQEAPETRILAVTGRNDPRAVREALAAGFHGYLTKDTALSRFSESVKVALQGQVVIPQALARGAAGAQSEEERDAALLASQLSPREREVLALLADGQDTVDIARHLHVSPNTARTHVQNILIKLQVRSRLQAVAFAVRYGIIATNGPTT